MNIPHGNISRTVMDRVTKHEVLQCVRLAYFRLASTHSKRHKSRSYTFRMILKPYLLDASRRSDGSRFSCYRLYDVMCRLLFLKQSSNGIPRVPFCTATARPDRINARHRQSHGDRSPLDYPTPEGFILPLQR